MMENQYALVKVPKEIRDLLKKAAPMLGMTMQDAAALAIERLVEEKAAWVLRHVKDTVDKEVK